MSRRVFPLLVGCLALLFTVPNARAQEVPLSSLPGKIDRDVPDEVKFRILLHQAAAFQAATTSRTASGKPTLSFQHHLEHKLALTSTDAQALMALGREYSDATSTLDSSAKEIRDEVKQLNADGELSSDKRADIHSRLAALQKSRDSVTVQYRDKLHQLLGDSTFARSSQLLSGMLRKDILPVKETQKAWRESQNNAGGK